MNTPKFKALLVAQQLSIEDLATKIGVDKSTIYRKIASNGDNFTVGEAKRIAEILDLSAEDSAQIFFAQNVASNATSVKE